MLSPLTCCQSNDDLLFKCVLKINKKQDFQNSFLRTAVLNIYLEANTKIASIFTGMLMQKA